MRRIAIIDYGGSNLRSVAKAVAHVAGSENEVAIVTTAADIDRADKVVFPGQGAMGQCMARLREHDLVDAVIAAARSKPFLGICLGLQCMFEYSEEDGGCKGLGVLAGRVVRITPTDATLKIPHMGWNNVRQMSPHALWQGIDDGERFYFVHSYVVQPDDPAIVTGATDYAQSLPVAVASGSLFACQFHPEKSQSAGLKLLENFVATESN